MVEVEGPPEDTGVATEPPGPPDISVDRESLDFGTLAVRTSITEVFHIANAGEPLLSLSSVALADGTGPFAVGMLDAAVLSPGERTTVSISCAPTEAGESQDLLVIESDDPDEPVVEVTLRGTALASLLSVSPSSVEFPPTALGCEAEQALTLSNVGRWT